ncbi:hypothetical protein ESA_01671 [Cronobacter sakazakii ATCC BAA-894]|uniref:Uncharacterized protein n=1 Tax=Cronobacter sakazakii (strain ATCC BAA-894) TaxID=290339 RepID=A7MLI1_CROS8|nr:hypothetical protein ESA_01671 [Cronobacter sakazakii ATCC BAA-894]
MRSTAFQRGLNGVRQFSQVVTCIFDIFGKLIAPFITIRGRHRGFDQFKGGVHRQQAFFRIATGGIIFRQHNSLR